MSALAIIVGSLAYLWCWRVAFRHVVDLERPTYRNLNGGDVGWSALVATAVGPLIAVYVSVSRLAPETDAEGVARLLGGESRKRKIARLEREARVREARVRQLEREVLDGGKPDPGVTQLY